MKLRFVKFFTSRENEIEKKEGGGRRTHTARPTTLSQPAARAYAPVLLPPSFLLSLPPPGPTQPTSSAAPASPPPRAGRAMSSSYPCHSRPASPFFFINYRSRRAWQGGPWRGAQLAGPAVLLNDNVAAPSSPATLAPSSNRVVAASLRFQWHPLCGG